MSYTQPGKHGDRQLLHKHCTHRTTEAGLGAAWATTHRGCCSCYPSRVFKSLLTVSLLQNAPPLPGHQFCGKVITSDRFNPERDRDYFWLESLLISAMGCLNCLPAGAHQHHRWRIHRGPLMVWHGKTGISHGACPSHTSFADTVLGGKLC